jgi:ATP-dependent RNA helicase RhlE
MLDMGFLPDIQRVLKHLPAKRQTLFFSATMPPPIASLARQILKDPVTVNMERPAAPAAGITQAVYPVPGNLKTHLLAELLSRGDLENVLVFTRTKHRANRLFEALARRGFRAERLHGNRSQAQRTQALAGFKEGRYRVLVATDIAARGIDVEALPHVVNFDVPHVPEDYIHRVGRTARAERTGDAFTFVSPEEEGDLRDIEKALGRRLPRVTVAGFDYKAAAAEKLEIPIAERIAAIRARKSAERERAKEKAERRALHEARERERAHAPRPAPPRPAPAPGHGRTGQPSGGRRRRRGRRPGAPRPATGRP